MLYDRLLKETGRFSNSPVFVVGIYSGQDKLGEGFGSSLKMAEYRVRGLSPRMSFVPSGLDPLPPMYTLSILDTDN